MGLPFTSLAFKLLGIATLGWANIRVCCRRVASEASHSFEGHYNNGSAQYWEVQ